MTISVGDTLPEADLLTLGESGPETVALSGILRGRRVVIFAVPGAYTPTCSDQHMPSFVRNADAIRASGVDQIVCVTVNDPFVAEAWASATGAGEAGIRVLADSDSAWTRALGMELNVPPAGLLGRSHRYAMLVDDGTVRILNQEDNPGVCTVASGDQFMDQLAALSGET
ncbi:MAG: peroxiredoxin [Paracoccaceae bacterium]|nr:peroxiredoxin [Paracoccaceae bacterium]